jgi:hypothetical protein
MNARPWDFIVIIYTFGLLLQDANDLYAGAQAPQALVVFRRELVSLFKNFDCLLFNPASRFCN